MVFEDIIRSRPREENTDWRGYDGSARMVGSIPLSRGAFLGAMRGVLHSCAFSAALPISAPPREPV